MIPNLASSARIKNIVMKLPGQPRNVVDDDRTNSALVVSAEREQFLQLSTLRRLRRFASLDELLDNLVTQALAVLAAALELCGQTEVFRLLFGADPRVYDRTCH